MRIRLGVCAFGCDGSEATYGAKGPGHVSSGNTAAFSVRTATDTHHHNVGYNTGASCHDPTTTASDHYADYHDTADYHDNSVAARW